MTVISTSDADDDLYDCASWYEDHRVGLGAEFFNAYESALKTIADTPRLFGRINTKSHTIEVRMAPIPRFRHFVTYAIINDVIRIIAIGRGRRQTSILKDRLDQLFSD